MKIGKFGPQGIERPYIEREITLPILVNGEPIKTLCRLVHFDAGTTGLYGVFVETIIQDAPWMFSHCIAPDHPEVATPEQATVAAEPAS